MPAARLKVGLIAGEASGSALGAGLMRALTERVPDVEFVGVGGEAMIAEGLDSWVPSSSLTVMGLTEVIRHLPRLLGLRRRLRRRFLDERPDVFVGIDLPDFNLGVARWLRRRGLRTMQYVSPSVWAWREGRVKGIARAVDEVLCLLPFEADFYADHGVAATFVGHPLADDIASAMPPAPARARLGLAEDDRVLAVLPGSRTTEVRALGDAFAGAVARLAAERPALHFVLPVAEPGLRPAIEDTFRQAAAGRLRLIDGDARTAMAAADVVLLATGTATLEAMLVGRPMVTAYRLSGGTRWLLETFRLLKVSRFSLPNLLADDDLVPEIMQDDVTPERLAAEVGAWLDDAERRTTLLERFETLRRRLANDASNAAARALLARTQWPA